MASQEVAHLTTLKAGIEIEWPRRQEQGILAEQGAYKLGEEDATKYGTYEHMSGTFSLLIAAYS